MTLSRASAPHYAWGLGCDVWHLVGTDTLSVIEERMPPGSFEQRHLHHRAHQFFYVLSGVLTVECDGEPHCLAVGEGLEIAAGTTHQVRNEGTDDVRFLVISQPPSHGDRTAA